MEGKQFDFWQDHSRQFLDMAFMTERREIIDHPDGYGKNSSDCGDTVEIYIIVQDGVIKHASFSSNGCINTSACANTVLHLAEGKSIKDAWKISPRDIIGYLETLPAREHHCADLATGALHRALSNYQENRREPWRKLYFTVK
jgi:nitrogen fixation protein NifU and related proteins